MHGNQVGLAYVLYRWLERVFAMVADGSLWRGWLDEVAIKDLLCDICSDVVRLFQFRPVYSGADSRPAVAASAPSPAQNIPTTFPPNEYIDGKAYCN